VWYITPVSPHMCSNLQLIDGLDYDDDGESQAGARLKHLLEILELDNVLVVVSRWYGGTLLGADRFKHINQAARDALELGGFLNDRDREKDAKGGKKGKK
jgi:putative IMPACT (imprinted ancient) family translation regulator